MSAPEKVIIGHAVVREDRGLWVAVTAPGYADHARLPLCELAQVHGTSLCWRCASSMRLHAMSKYLRSNSMPMNLRPRFMQATPVVPDPINGSTTVSPSRDTLLTIHVIWPNGLGQGWPFFSAPSEDWKPVGLLPFRVVRYGHLP